MSAAALLALAMLQGGQPAAREVVRAIDYAVDRGKLDSVEVAWRTQPPRGVHSRTRSLVRAKIALYRYRFAEAEKTLRELRDASLGDDVARYAALELARMTLVQGYAAAAIPLLQQVEQAARSAHDTVMLLDALVASSHAKGVASSPAAGLALIDSTPAFGTARDAIATQCRSGRLLSQAGDHRRAREELHKAITKANESGLARTEARCRLALLTSFVYAGLTDSVRVQFRAAEALATKAGDLESIAVARQWVGVYVRNLGQPRFSREYLDSAVTLARLTRMDDVLAWAAHTLADLALDFGDAKDAWTWLGLADSLMRARGDASGLASSVALQSRVAWARGDYNDAFRLTDSVIARATRAGNAAGQVSGYDLQRIAALRMGRLAAAEQALVRQRDLTTRYQLGGYEPALRLAEAQIALWSGSFARADSLFAVRETTLHPSQFSLKHDVLMYRAIAHLSTGNLVASERFGRDAGIQYTSWRASLSDPNDRRRAVQSAHSFGDTYGLPRLIAELVRRGRAETALELSEQRRAQTLREALDGSAQQSTIASATASDTARTVDVRRLQAMLPDAQTAAIEYVLGVGDAPTTMIVVTRDTIVGFDLGPQRALSSRVARFSALLESRRDARQLARELGNELIEPARALLARGVRRLVIVPDGPLNFVPFDALLLADGRHVLDAYETWMTPSLSIAVHSWQRRESTPASVQRSLVFGDPAYARRSFPIFRSAARGAALDLPRLPASGREAQRVARWLGNTEVALGKEASEARFKDSTARELRVLHVAGHAVVDDWSSERSFIALAPGSGHDGIVRAADLAALGFRATLVVLSACRTARGEVIGGEGVQGLAQPFLERGTRAVVATTWAVEDRHALALTDHFYRALAGGSAIGAALHQAKKALKASGASPSEWGAYALLGDGLLRIAPVRTN